MTLYEHTFACVHIHTFPGINAYHLESAKALDFYQFIAVNTFLNHIEDSRHKTLCIPFVQLVFLYEHIGQFINRQLSHYSFPPDFILSFHC